MRIQSWFLLPCTCLVVACGGDSGGPGPSGSTGTVSGTVTSAASGAALAGATVSIGQAQATSDANGHFELDGIRPSSSVEIQCTRAGFLAYSVAIAVQEGDNSHDIVLSAQEVYSFSDFALYLPASVAQVRGVIVALGGPDTRAFVDGRPSGEGAIPELEESLQALGEQFRALARDSGFAVLGSGSSDLANTSESDGRVLTTLATAAVASGRAELSSVPLIIVAASSGAAEAFGLTERQAARVAGFVLLVPVRLNTTLASAARQVPGYLALHEMDNQVDVLLTTQQFLGNRAAGALWGLSVEPGQTHSELSDESRAAMVHWMAAAAGLRLPASPGGALRSVAESSGWLGNQTTFEIAPYGSYTGDPHQASWLPTAATAAEWQGLFTP